MNSEGSRVFVVPARSRTGRAGGSRRFMIRQGSLIVSISIVILSLIQGESGPLSFLRASPWPEFGAATAVLVALSMRDIWVIRAEKIAMTCGLSFIAVMVLGNLLAGAPLGQWRVAALFLWPFLIAMLVPVWCRDLLLIAVLGSGLVQLIVVLMSGEIIWTLSGIPQLSGGIQPNILGLIAAVTATWGMSLALSPQASAPARAFGAAVVCIGFLAVYQTVSRTGLITLLVGVGSVAVLRRSRTGAVLLALSLVAGLAVVPWDLIVAEASDWFVRGDAESISSLTGRTTIWALAIDYVGKKPLMGWGFGGLYAPQNTAGEFLSEVVATNTHNAPLQLLFETGIFGTIPALIFLGHFLRRAWLTRGARRAFVLPLFAVLLVNSIGSAGFATIGYANALLAGLFCALKGAPTEDETGASDVEI